MSVTATGPETLAVAAARYGLARCGTFQTWVGADAAAGDPPVVPNEAAQIVAAGLRIYEVREETYTRPCALLDYGPLRSEGIALGVFEKHGTVLIRFLASVDPTHDDEAAARAFLNYTGTIMDEFVSLVGAGYLNVEGGYERKDAPVRTNEDEAATLGDSYVALYSVDWWGG